MTYLRTLLVAALIAMLAGCATTGSSVSQKRQSLLDMRRDVLNKLYMRKPDVRAQVDSAAGYGVFSNANVHLLYFGGSKGRGIVENNRTGERTYMKMGAIGAGIGLGAKDYRVLMVFHDAGTLDRFVNAGWSFGGEADASAKASDQGRAVGGAGSTSNITIYQFTESGLSLQATVSGTKYWPDDELN
jgi:lipid-binding SYLF domain-containing protein